MIIVMELQEGTGRQKCPKCPAVIIDSPIPDRICWKCSPQASRKQLKAHSRKTDDGETIVVSPKNEKWDAYSATESFLQKWHDDNGVNVPDCFANWGIYFFSRGSMLREWGRCMNYWMKDEDCDPVTDMTPGKDLERKIRERREATGRPGPGFRTVEDKVANLRGALDRMSPSYSSQVHTPTRGVVQVNHKEPSIPRPTGETGAEHVII